MSAAGQPGEAALSSLPFVALEWPRRLLVFAYLGVSAWYLHWRLGTFNPDALLFSWVVYGAECFGLLAALLHFFMCWRLPVRKSPPVPAGLTIDVFVPTYNESVDLVRKTLLAAQAMDQAHETWLLDDGRRPEMAALAEELGCHYLARADNQHAKAGNLNHALQHSRADLVAVFDADHAPSRDFLARTLGYFNDERVAFVQTPQDFYNLDSYQHRSRPSSPVIWTEQSLFFRVIQRGKDYWNAAYYCGSCAVVRRSALDEIGGFATGTVTEDLHTSLRIHARGWKSVYHAEPLAFGLAPESIEPFISQRVRWGQGAMHVWRKEGLLTHPGLTFAQRLNYFASVLTYFDGWQKAVFYIAPVIVLTTGTMPLLTSVPDFLLHFLPYYLLAFLAFEEVGRGYGRILFLEQYNMARFAAFAWATLAWLVPRRKFRVTPKGAGVRRWQHFVLPQYTVLGLSLLSIPVGTLLYFTHRWLPWEALLFNVLWACFNGSLALAVLWFTRRTQRNQRHSYRFPMPLSAHLVLPDGRACQGTVDDISGVGLRFYGPVPNTLSLRDVLYGILVLPDGPLRFRAEVRSLLRLKGTANLKAIGCALSLQPSARNRLEGFLFGSDLQWKVNGYTDQIETPLSWLLPRWVQGPQRPLLAGLRWNGAEIGAHDSPSLMPALLSVARGEKEASRVLSYAPLPQGVPLAMHVFRRTETQQRWVALQALPNEELQAAGVFLYQIQPAEPPAAQELPPAEELAA